MDCMLASIRFERKKIITELDLLIDLIRLSERPCDQCSFYNTFYIMPRKKDSKRN